MNDNKTILSISNQFYVSPNPVKSQNKKFAKIQKIDNHSYQIKQLFHAVQHGYLDYLKMVPKNFLKNCFNILDDENCFSLLHYAVYEKHKDMVAYLLTFNGNVNIIASKKVRPIHLAAQRGLGEIIELLCCQKSINIDATDDKGQTALHIACRRGHYNVAEILLNHGASVHKLETDKISVMHHPVRRNDFEMIKLLCLYNSPLTIKNNNGQTPIMIAVIEGHLELLIFLLKKVKEINGNVKSCIDEQDIEGKSCISYAVQNRNSEIVKICIFHGADINMQQIDEKTIFHTAAIIGYEKLFEMVDLKTIKIDAVDIDLNTPVHHAVMNSNANMVNLLIKLNVNINSCNRLFQTPILIACSTITQNENDFQIIKYLVNAKADLRIRDEKLKTIFHHLVEKENIKVIEYLINNISQDVLVELINSQDNKFNSSLHYAAQIGNREICKILLKNGANPKLFANNDYLPLHFATIHGHFDVVKLLLETNFETKYFRDTNEGAAIHLAAEYGQYDIFKYLVDNGNDILAKDEYGRNTLMSAARSGSLEIVEFLLKNEININLYDQTRTTSLHQAASEGHLEIVKCLLKHGATFSDNIYNESPLDVAIINGHENVVKYFLNDENWRKTMEYRHRNGDSHIESLIKYNEEITEELLNRCVTENTTNKMDPNYEKKYWFGLLDAGPYDSASSNQRYYALKSMTLYKRLNLLKHPLTENLLTQKWRKFGLGFLICHAFIYCVFLGFIMVYIEFLKPIENGEEINTTTNCRNYQEDDEIINRNSLIEYQLTVYILMGMVFCIQLVKLLHQKFRFFKDIWNVNFFICCFFCFGFIQVPGKYPCVIEWSLASIFVLLSFSGGLYFLQFIPGSGIHVIMFHKVLMTTFKIFITFFCLIFGFASAFFIINSEEKIFSNPINALFKTVSMMLGEFDFLANFVTNQTKYNDIALFIMLIFFITMPIALLNLIVGLAIGDIDKIMCEATLESLKFKIDYIWEVESCLFKPIQKYFYQIEYYERPKLKKKRSEK